jgi:hypothetical protein
MHSATCLMGSRIASMQSAERQDITKQSGRVTYSAGRTTSKKGPNRDFVPVLTLKLPLRKFKRYKKSDKKVLVSAKIVTCVKSGLPS